MRKRIKNRGEIKKKIEEVKPNGEDDFVTMNFRVEFDTKGKDLAIIGSLNEFGSWDKEKFLKLTWNKGNIWSTKLRIPLKNEIEMIYYYVEVENGSIARWEDNQHKVRIDLSYKGHDILFLDRWLLSSQYDSINDSSAFKIMRNRHTQKVNPSILLPTPSDDKVCFRLNLKHFNLKDNETIYVCGSDETLGNWNLERAVQMTDDSFPNLQATFSIPKSRANSFEYKLVKGPKDNITNDNSQWDVLLNKKVSIEETPEISCVIVDCAPFIGDKNLRAAGVSVPVFSLRSEESLGIGEFSDLKLLVDFSKKVGISMIQTLPVNDTNTTGDWKDNYPYSPLSVSALHPIYVRIQQIDGISNKILNKIKILKPEMDEKFLDYEKTLKVKLELLHEIFLEQKETFFKDRDYTKWFSSNKEWLVPYAVFCALRDKNGTSDYNKWKKYGKVSKEEITQLSNKNSEIYDQVAENYFIQYHASKQLREASEYASSLGVAIKGDLPIGVDLFSCDVWLHRNLFITDFSMGGPPDPFNDIGENWSFPIYNWDEMEKDDYAWWRNRLKVLSNYFHAIRIDHVLGFFRAWSIPREHINSHLGFYVPSIPFSEKEFEEKGIWDFERLSKPYTTMEELKRNFTESKCHSIIGEYLEEVSSERYTFKKQIKAEKELIKRIEKNKEEKEVKEFLLKTFINRVLIEDPQLPKHYHFRVFMQKTSSYQNLDNNWRRQLEELYIDYFDSRQDNLWRTRALKTLPMMQNTTDMLVCAENVGTIPSCTQKVLDQLSILGLRIQRWPKKNDEKLENPLNYSFFNVCSPSVHDSSTIRGWWEEDRLSAKLLGEMIGLEGNLPIECKPEIVEKILALNLKSPAILVIIAIQDFLALDDDLCINNPQEERVNIPANPYPSWKYRMPFTMDKLLLREEWLLKISHLIKCSDRE